MQDIVVAPEVRNLGSLAAQLTPWLGSRLTDVADLSVSNLTYPHGAGQSHETILFDVSGRLRGEPFEQGCVVRIKPTRHTMYPDDLFEQQFQIMRALHDDGRVRVAKPLWFEPSPQILGAPFFVLEKKQGRVPVSIPPYAQVGWVADATPAQRAKMWENGVRQLAAIQGVPLEGLDFLKGPEHAREGLEQEWDKYLRFIEWVSQERRWPALEKARDRLRASWPANKPPGLVWGDSRLGNMMFDDDFDVVAVMDWEQPSLGGALHDLAWWLNLSAIHHNATADRPYLEGMGTREETIALWHELTGKPTADIEWYEDFSTLKQSCLGIRMAHLKSQTPPTDEWLARRLKVTL